MSFVEPPLTAQEALTRYQAVVAASPDMLHLLDSEGRFLSSHIGKVTPFLEMQNYIGKTVWEVFPKTFAKEIMNHIKTTLVTGEMQEWEYSLKDIPNSYFEARMVQVQVNVTQTDKGQVFAIIRDITKRKALEQKIQASEQRFRLAFDASPNPKALSSVEDARFIRVNPAFCELMGYTEKQLLGKTFEMVTYPEDLETSKKWVEQAKKLKPSDPVKFLKKRYRRKNGSIVWGEVSIALLREFDETPTNFLIQVRDITTLVQVQTQLEQKVAERTKQLQASNEALQSFAYAASHDLREPLNKISAFGKQLADKYSNRLDDKGLQYLNIMQSAAQRMTRLIDDLLEFSKIGSEPNFTEEIDLNDLVDEVLTDLEIPILKTHAKIEIETLPIVQGHPARFRQVFQNLLSNALKFKHPDKNPIIQVSGKIEEDKAILRVQDNGIGFEPQYADKIFTVFTRLHTRFDYPGTGIGLALCRRILTQYGGQISAQGVPNEGSIFTVTVPIPGIGNASGDIR